MSLLLYLEGPQVKQALADELSCVNMFNDKINIICCAYDV